MWRQKEERGKDDCPFFSSLALTLYICFGSPLEDETEMSFYLSFHHNNELPISECPLLTITHTPTQTHTHTNTLRNLAPNLHDNQLPFIVLHHAGNPLLV